MISLLSDDDSDGAEPVVPKKSKRKAKAPESYTREELKRFASVARSIKNVDPDKGHTLATAQFIDEHFSDNSEKCVRPIKSKNWWKKNQFAAIADKAAQVMRDRVKLFNKGNEIAKRTRDAKLEREYKKLTEIDSLI